MIVPTIHMNGTSRQHLLDEVCAAGSALMNAMEALAKAAPNGRDYYPQGPEAIKQAGIEHRERIAKVKEVYDEVQRLAEAIADAD